MQIQVNEQGVVTGWATLGGFEGGIEVSSLPEDMACLLYTSRCV